MKWKSADVEKCCQRQNHSPLCRKARHSRWFCLSRSRMFACRCTYQRSITRPTIPLFSSLRPFSLSLQHITKKLPSIHYDCHGAIELEHSQQQKSTVSLMRGQTWLYVCWMQDSRRGEVRNHVRLISIIKIIICILYVYLRITTVQCMCWPSETSRQNLHLCCIWCWHGFHN